MTIMSPMDGWGPSEWCEDQHKQYEVIATLCDGCFSGIIIQVSDEASDLLDSLTKAKDMRFKKKMHLSSILPYFKRYKQGRDRIPPLSYFQTASESEPEKTIESTTRTRTLCTQNAATSESDAQPYSALPLLPLEPNHMPLPQTSSALPPEQRVNAMVSESTLTPNRRTRDSGKFSLDTQPYLRALKNQGIDPYSAVGHTHLLTAILHEVTQIKHLQQTQRRVASDKDEEISKDAVECYGLPLTTKTDYEELVKKAEDKEFRFELVKYLRRLGGKTAEKMVNRMLDTLLDTSLQKQFNKTGRDYESPGRPKTKISMGDFIEPLIQSKCFLA